MWHTASFLAAQASLTSWSEVRMSTIRDVVMVRNTGCRNSRRTPRPTNLSFSIGPPHVDPAILNYRVLPAAAGCRASLARKLLGCAHLPRTPGPLDALGCWLAVPRGRLGLARQSSIGNRQSAIDYPRGGFFGFGMASIWL